MTVSLPITERITAQIEPNLRGVNLALAEVHQFLGRWQEAVGDLRRLHRENPDDPVVLLSLCELLVEEDGSPKAAREVVSLTAEVDNLSEVEAAILLWKGKALRILQLNEAARDALTAGLRRQKDRSADLLNTLRYERVLVYQALGAKRQVRAELEKLYAVAPDFEDVAERLSQ